MIYAALNQKGGAGKTTLAVHLACWLVDHGRRVAFLDTDPQQSGAPWFRAAQPDAPCESPTAATPVLDALQRLAGKGYDVVCDGPPRMNDVTNTIMYYADRLLIPVGPSTVDLRATLACKAQLDRVLQAQFTDGVTPGRAFLVVNRVRAATELSRTVVSVARGLGIDMASQTIGLRDAYAKACTIDTVVTRMKKDKSAAQAAQEINSLFKEISHVEHPAAHAA